MSWVIKTYNGTSESTRTPFYPSINFTYNRVEGQVYYRRECTTSFRFLEDDYDYFKNLLDTSYCGTLELRLYWNASLKYTGQIKLRSSIDWDFDNCRVDIVALPKDDYNTLFSDWETKYNILNTGTLSTIEAKVIVGTIEVTQVITVGTPGPTQPTPDPAPGPAASTWVLDRSEWDSGLGFLTQDFSREQITVACSGGSPVSPGADWTLADDNCATTSDARYVRPVEVYLTFSTTDLQIWTIVGAGDSIDEYDNGLLYNDVLEYLADQAGFTIVSDFFGINADATAPANDVYTAASAGMQTLGIWQKSDIKRGNAAQNATIGETTLKDQLEFLQAAFDVYFTVDGTEIRIEHITYFSQSNGEDLTSTSPNNITNTSKFSFLDGDNHPREKYEWMDVDPTGDIDFIGKDITYNCADDEEDSLKIKIEQFSTDFSSIIGNSEGYSDAGFVLISLSLISGNYGIQKEIGELSGSYKLNGHLSWANIHENYKQDYRPQPTGTINGASVTFDSTKPRKRQVPITIYRSVDDYFNFDPNDKINTYLGYGMVESTEYNSKTCKLTITLLYD